MGFILGVLTPEMGLCVMMVAIIATFCIDYEW